MLLLEKTFMLSHDIQPQYKQNYESLVGYKCEVSFMFMVSYLYHQAIGFCWEIMFSLFNTHTHTQVITIIHVNSSDKFLVVLTLSCCVPDKTELFSGTCWSGLLK